MSVPGLEAALQGCSHFPFQSIVERVLAASGYGEIQNQGRFRPRQRTRNGGHELLCTTLLGGKPMKVAVKLIRGHVNQRMLDELYGVIRRVKVDQGLIVTSGHLTKSAWLAIAEHRPSLRAIDGETLAAQCQQFGIGVRGSTEVDYEYFGSLELLAPEVLAKIDELRS